MPRIGFRMIKTAIAVTLCMILFILILGINYSANRSFVEATMWYSPFFSAIAAAYSVATTKQSSIRQARIRIVASIIGGMLGMMIILIYTKVLRLEWPFSMINSFGEVTSSLSGIGYILSFIPASVIICIACVTVIYICVLTKQKDAAFVSVLTLTAVLCSLGTSPLIYGVNRIISTIFGVLFALLVNLFHLPHYKNKNILFVVGIDGFYIKDDKKVEGYVNYRMNNLAYYGANLCLFTTRTPATLLPMLENVSLNTPVLCMSGAALYDTKEKKYLYTESMSLEISERLRRIFREMQISPIVNLIEENVLYSYCNKIDNLGMKAYVDQRKNSAYTCFVPREAPSTAILYFVLVAKIEDEKKIMDGLKKSEIYDRIKILIYDYFEVSGEIGGYSYIKIYSKEIEKLNGLNSLSENKKYDRIGLTTHKNDLHMLQNVAYSYTSSTADNMIQKECNEVLNNKSVEPIFKKVTHLFHSRYKTKE